MRTYSVRHLGSRDGGQPNAVLGDSVHITSTFLVSVWHRPEELVCLQQPSLGPHRYKGSGGKRVVPEPGGYAGAETHQQDHRLARGLLQARPSSVSAWYADPTEDGQTKRPGGEGLTQNDLDGKNQPQLSRRSLGGKQEHSLYLCKMMRCADSQRKLRKGRYCGQQPSKEKSKPWPCAVVWLRSGRNLHQRVPGVGHM